MAYRPDREARLLLARYLRHVEAFFYLGCPYYHVSLHLDKNTSCVELHMAAGSKAAAHSELPGSSGTDQHHQCVLLFGIRRLLQQTQ